MNAKIKATAEKIEEDKQEIATNEDLQDTKQKELDEIREKNQTAAIECSEIDLDELKQLKDDSEIAQEQERHELEETIKKRAETEAAIRQLVDDGKKQQIRLNALKNDIAQEANSIALKQQRLDHDKKLFDQLLKSKIDSQQQRIGKANENMAGELTALMQKKEAIAKESTELNEKADEGDHKIVEMTAEIEQIKCSIEEIEEKIKTTEVNTDEELMKQKEKLIQTVENLNKEREKLTKEINHATAKFNAKVEREKRKQAIDVLVEGEKSGNESAYEEMSLMESYDSSETEGILEAAKIDFDVTIAPSEEENTLKKE